MFHGSNPVYELVWLGFEGEVLRGGDCVCVLFVDVKVANTNSI